MGVHDHYIRTIKFDLNFLDEDIALKEFVNLEDYFYTRILPIIEKGLTKYSSSTDRVSFDRFSIDLGNLDLSSSDTSTIEIEVEKAIAIVFAKEELYSKSKVHTSKSDSILNCYFDFLKNGFFSWSSPVKTIKEVEDALLPLFSGTSEKNLVLQLRVLLRDKNVRKRFVGQHGSDFLSEIVNRLVPSSEHPKNTQYFSAFSEFQQRAILLAIALKDSRFKTVSKKLPLITGEDPDFSKIIANFEEFLYLLEFSDADFYSLATNSSKIEITENRNLLDDPIVEVTNSIEGKVFVKGAGIVILHPYLTRLFSELSLLDENSFFRSNTHKLKAIFILNYLCNECLELEEQDSILFKMLLEFPLNITIPQTLALSIRELEECEQLLTAIIVHWSILKNTTNSGLRETFLTREGYFVEGDNVYNITVNRNSFDVLLAQLPWSISMIKLPWLTKMIKVSWL